MHRPSRRRSRRRAPRKAVAAAAAIVCTASLAACSGDDGGTPELIWYINPDAGGQDAVAEACSTDAYTISTQVLPQDSSQQRIQLARRLAAGDPAIDLMSLDPPFTAEFANAGYLAEIPQDMQDKFREQAFDSAADRGDVGGRAGGRPVLVQHAGALVPQVLRGEGRHRHGAAGHLGPDHRGRQRERRQDRGPGQQVRGLLRVDQRPDLRGGGPDRRPRPRRAPTRRSTSRRTPGRRPPGSSRSWPRRRPPPPTSRCPTRAPPAPRSAGTRARSWSTGPTSGATTATTGSVTTSASPATPRRSRARSRGRRTAASGSA